MQKAWIVPIANAIVWGFVIIMCSLTLKGTGAYQEIQNILGGGAAASLFITALCFLRKRKKDEKAE